MAAKTSAFIDFLVEILPKIRSLFCNWSDGRIRLGTAKIVGSSGGRGFMAAAGPQVVYSRPQSSVAWSVMKICPKRWDTNNVQRGGKGAEFGTRG